MDDTISVITDVTDAQVETGDVNLDMIENWNELELREAQVSITLVFLVEFMSTNSFQITRLLTLLDNRLIQDEIKQLSKDVSLVMHEGERDDTSLPLDLWKKPVRLHVNYVHSVLDCL